MKTAIYAIAKNEQSHVERFMASCQDADLVLVGDTGSTDDTRQHLTRLGAEVVDLHVSPWRFDLPRNTVLSLLPADVDVCIALDLDEILVAGWRQLLEQRWQPEHHTRLRFRYVHSFRRDGSPGTVGMKDFAHARNGYIWKHAVHEKLYRVADIPEQTLTLPEMCVEHRQDPAKTRASYRPLLELECGSDTATPQHIFWLIREYVYAADWSKVLIWGEKFLQLPQVWRVERAHAMRYMAKAERLQQNFDRALTYHIRSVDAAPGEREPWLDLAWFHQERKEWPQAYAAVRKCLSLTSRPEHYLTENLAWGFRPYDLAAICAAHVGLDQQARHHLKEAWSLAPNDPYLLRTVNNLGVELPL